MAADELVRRLRDSDAVAIMKLGRTFPKVSRRAGVGRGCRPGVVRRARVDGTAARDAGPRGRPGHGALLLDGDRP